MKHVKLLLVALLLSLSGTANAQSKEQMAAVLDSFCQSYYEDAFNGKQYIEGSLYVTTLEVNETTGAFHVKGKHSYRGQYIILYGRKTHSNVDFKADVTPTNSGLKVKFWKWYEPDVLDPKGHWEGPCEKTIIP